MRDKTVNEPANEMSLSELANCRLKPSGKAMLPLLVMVIVGVIAAIVNCQFVDHPAHRFMQGYLVAFAFVLSISLGCLFFVLIQHLMRAGWAVVVRRFAEIFCMNMMVVGLLFLPIAWSVWDGSGLIYQWSQTHDAHSEAHEHGNRQSDEHAAGRAPARTGHQSATQLPMRPPVLAASFVSANEQPFAEAAPSHAPHTSSKPFLNNTRFLITWAGLFLIWMVLGGFYYRCSVGQDQSGNVDLTRRMEWWSGIAMIAFGFSLTIGSFDLLMSLDPMWYSTIFGVYYFAGSAVSGLAVLLLVVLLLRRLDLVPSVFSDEVQRDLGRLLFAFVFFWAYIAFSQYMLLWYANMPETTGWLVRRGMSTATGYANSWGWLAVLLLLAHFVIPFCGFMSRHVKSNSKWMAFWCIWLLVIHYLDLYWIVIPESNSGLTVSLIEIGTVVAVVGVYGMGAMWIASRANLFAVGDPRMHESLTRDAMY